MKVESRSLLVRWIVVTFAALAVLFVSTSAALAQGYSVSAARPATVESIREVVQQKSNSSPLGMIAGGLIGGGIGSLFGAGNGRTAATIVGALGGGYIGHNLEKSQTQMVYEIAVKYDDGTWATIRQSSSPPFRIGDRVLVTDRGLELLR
jgi:outer membrane lipoprotein SlyB